MSLSLRSLYWVLFFVLSLLIGLSGFSKGFDARTICGHIFVVILTLSAGYATYVFSFMVSDDHFPHAIWRIGMMVGLAWGIISPIAYVLYVIQLSVPAAG